MRTNCLILYSGGLDSILACKVIEEQGIRPVAIQFTSPFFGFELKRKGHIEKVRQKYGIELYLVDLSDEYLRMVVNPPHGYGRYLNPCIDCKILMVKKALSLMKEFEASFIATGEVLGQRPMSQRKDTLWIIERDSGAQGKLLRPLSARFLPETPMEKEGLVNRDLLPAISGRSRKLQMTLAKRFKITDYPAPAGGCVLADPILSRRFKRIFETWPDFSKTDCISAQTGRHFLIEETGWVMVGRNQAENMKLERLALPGDLLVRPKEVPGPICIVRYSCSDKAVEIAGRICARYSKKLQDKGQFKVLVQRIDGGPKRIINIGEPATDSELDEWRF